VGGVGRLLLVSDRLPGKRTLKFFDDIAVDRDREFPRADDRRSCCTDPSKPILQWRPRDSPGEASTFAAPEERSFDMVVTSPRLVDLEIGAFVRLPEQTHSEPPIEQLAANT